MPRPIPSTCVPGIKFSDGSPITADDVKFSIERMKAGEIMKGQLANVTAVTVVDPATVTVTLSEPSGALAITLSRPGSAAILPMKAVQSQARLLLAARSRVGPVHPEAAHPEGPGGLRGQSELVEGRLPPGQEPRPGLLRGPELVGSGRRVGRDRHRGRRLCGRPAPQGRGQDPGPPERPAGAALLGLELAEGAVRQQRRPQGVRLCGRPPGPASTPAGSGPAP